MTLRKGYWIAFGLALGCAVNAALSIRFNDLLLFAAAVLCGLLSIFFALDALAEAIVRAGQPRRHHFPGDSCTRLAIDGVSAGSIDTGTLRDVLDQDARLRGRGAS